MALVPFVTAFVILRAIIPHEDFYGGNDIKSVIGSAGRATDTF
jgi:hypothetical protein